MSHLHLQTFIFVALKLLKIDLTDISAEASSDPKYILLYFYYGALILTAVKVRLSFYILRSF